MSMHNLNKEIEKILKGRNAESIITEQFSTVIKQYGVIQVETWRNMSNDKKNPLLHELVERKYLNVIRNIVPKFNLRTTIKREKDNATPFEVAHSQRDWEMCDLLLELGVDKTFTDTYEQYAMKKQKDKMMNIVWLDLEFTSFDNPEILECAVIVTDKDLNELERKQWVVHFEKEILDGLGEWHQNTFKNHNDGGNGLFADVIASNITKEQMGEELLELLKRHCPEKACPLAGSSIHVDREVMKTQMPTVYSYLHYRVIDVSSFREMMKRWAPATASRFVREIAENTKEGISHRAMDDIEWSIELMKMFRPLLTARKFTTDEPNSSDRHRGTSERSIVQKNRRPIILTTIDRSTLSADEKYLINRMQHEQSFDVNFLKLNNNYQRIYDQNPHLRELFTNYNELLICKEQFTDKSRLLDVSLNKLFPEIVNRHNINTTEYWEQRRLLLSEIEFLTKYATNDGCLVVYAGAAPGTHINYLSSLFPEVEFILIDINPFVTSETEKITIRPEFMTEDLAQIYSETNKTTLFIYGNNDFNSYEHTEEDILTDLNNQMLFHSIMKPRTSLLKFRLSNVPGKILFFDGHMLLDVWSSRTFFQCRLIVEADAQTVEYDNTDFNRAMNYFQNVIRTMYYEHDFDTVQTEGLDHCYDCQAEIFILQNYLSKMKKCTDDKEVKTKIAELSYNISRNIHERNRQPITNTIRTLNIIPRK